MRDIKQMSCLQEQIGNIYMHAKRSAMKNVYTKGVMRIDVDGYETENE